MLTALSIFIKEKLFSTAGSFLLIFAIIISVFVFSNTNVILSKFGFETTTNLKSELTQSQNDLKAAVLVNEDLNKTIETMKEVSKLNQEVLVEKFKETEEVKVKVEEIKKTRNEKVKPFVKVLDEKTVITKETVTFPVEEYNKVSMENIVAINKAYDLLMEDVENV